MKTPRIVILLAFFILSIPSWCAGVDDAVKKALLQIEGDWSMVSGSADGEPLPDSMIKQMKRTFTGDELIVTRSGQPFFKAKITIDPSKKPKTIDYEMTEGFTKGKRQLGIYEIEGGTFKSSFAAPGGARPTDFSSKSGDGRTVTVWKKAEK